MNLSIKFSGLSNSEVIALGEGVNNAVKELTGVEAMVQPFQELLQKCKNAVNNVLEKTTAKEVSAMLKKEDNLRDQFLVGLRKTVDAGEYHPNETVKVAANKIMQLLNKVGSGIQEQSYDKESVSIKILLTDLEGDYADDVNRVHATPFVKALSECQTRFDTYRQQQLGENVEMAEIESMSSIRREFEQSIRAIFDVLPAFYMINKSDEYKKAIALIQEVIQKIK